MNSEIDKVWNEYIALPGIDSSYFSKQAQEEIKAEIEHKRAIKMDTLADVSPYFNHSVFPKFGSFFAVSSGV